jgi:hypothetical protein
MRSAGWLLPPLAVLAWAGPLPAQVLVPGPPAGSAIVVGPSVGYSHPRRGPRVIVMDPYGFAPWGRGPYRVVTRQVTINVYLPPPILVVPAPEEDLSGVDLDTVPPPWKAKEEAAAPPRQPEKPRAKPAPPPPPAKLKPPPAPRKKEPALPAPPALPEDPATAAGLLIANGAAAFANEDYGLAAQRFRHAARLDRTSARARFLLAQALFALGKYREAVAAIHEGMDLDLNWPRAPFRPRLDLYKGNEAALADHLQGLKEALAGSPDNRFFLFLYAYQLWFDGRQADAVPFFQRARAVTVDTTYIDRFLRAAPGGAVAALEGRP